MFKQLSIAVIVLFAIGHVANAQTVHFGQCPNVTLPQTFSWGDYVGTWYEYARYPFAFEFATKCNTAQYTDAGNGTVGVNNTAISKITGKVNEIEGFAKVVGAGKLAVVFFPGQSETESNYHVIGTDYKTFAVVYSCKNFSFLRIDFLWVLTRERNPSAETVAAAYKVLEVNKISTRFLLKTNQKDCPAQ